ncbi:MAG: ATP-binding protein [Methanoregula sp.]|jgi:hypothetical protein|nr:ATP-binding protein [Methanoregula sp.]
MISLKDIQRASIKPPRIIVYGDAGIGKTTFAAGAPAPVVILTEDGLGVLDVPNFPLATSLDDVLEALQSLAEEEHDFKTVVVDSLDWLEPLIWNATCKRLGVSSIEAPGYGKGYVEASTEWRKFFSYVTALRDEKGMIIIMTAHSVIMHVEDPIHPAYDMHDMKLHKRGAAIAEEYSDIIGFCSLKTLLTSEDAGFGGKRTRAISTGERIINLSANPSYNAKNRYGMPETLPLVWSEFEQHIPSGAN